MRGLAVDMLFPPSTPIKKPKL